MFQCHASAAGRQAEGRLDDDGGDEARKREGRPNLGR